jgi:protein involved in polysaccharide export with SLBB domain
MPAAAPGIRIHHHELRSMPMTRPPAPATIVPRGINALLAASCALAIAICAWPQSAHAQFTGNPSNDLTSQGSADVGQINGQTAAGGTDSGDATTQLRQSSRSSRTGNTGDQPESRGSPYPRERYQLSEFERYVQQLVTATGSAQDQAQDDQDPTQTAKPRSIRRFGANLVTDDALASATQDPLPAVPGDYIVRSGDQINLTVWGAVDADLQLTVDRAGRISVPRVGAITVAGLRNVDLAEAISHRVGQTFRNFQLTATLGQVRPIRVFVGGYVQHPGSITVNGLSSVLHALMRTGGPSSAGSFRDVHLRRGSKEVGVFDLYDLLLKGSRDADQLVQPDDVIFVGAIGTQVAILGSVNQPAIYELKPGETLDDLLHMAGGFNAVADRGRVTIERLADRSTGKVSELTLPAHDRDPLATGDVVRAYSAVSVALPQERQNQHVRVEGEVVHPGDYLLPPGSRIEDALRVAGGLTSSAYPFGTEFTRESVRKVQQVSYERALRDFETDITKNQANQRATSAEELSAQSSAAQSNARLLERLRQIRPNGRVVLQLQPTATRLPNLALEDGDTLTIPQRGSSVGIFGSVFNTGSFVYQPGRTTGQYLALAGGPTRGADKQSAFMIRANGSVISARQGATFWHSGNEFEQALVEPGDAIFVPEELGKATFVQDAKDWTQILYQFGLGLAGIKSLGL